MVWMTLVLDTVIGCSNGEADGDGIILLKHRGAVNSHIPHCQLCPQYSGCLHEPDMCH